MLVCFAVSVLRKRKISIFDYKGVYEYSCELFSEFVIYESSQLGSKKYQSKDKG